MPARAINAAMEHIRRLRKQHRKKKEPMVIPGAGVENPRHPKVAARQIADKLEEITDPAVLRSIRRKAKAAHRKEMGW